jgi:cyclopropane fatty-acyl-phospholipid synthase-like methyltransferase
LENNFKNLPIAEACLRNQEPIAEVLKKILLTEKTLLEIGSGTGQHAVFVCKQMPELLWQPSEMPERVADVEAWRNAEKLLNLLPTKELDVLQNDWLLDKQYDAVFTANTVHYISWEKVEALLKGASRHLNPNGKLIVYGPFNDNQAYTSEGNQKLDQWLKQRDATSGIKDRKDFTELAKSYHFEFIEWIQMPANNIILHFQLLRSL